MHSYKYLQNGSDIRGIALTGIEGEDPNLRKEDAARIGKGFLIWLCDSLGKNPDEIKIAIGRDPRLSGKHLRDGFIQGVKPYGVQVYECGIASTPAMFMSTKFEDMACDAGVMITASHLPFNRNGFKFFTEEGGLNKSDISEIIAYAEDDEKTLIKTESPELEVEEIPLMAQYSRHLRNIIIEAIDSGEKPLQGMKIVVDAGNGSGGFYAKNVLYPLGADISDSQCLSPDGTFPSHIPNPENKEVMATVCAQVLSSSANLGIVFDTDVDRSAAVDNKGNPIGRNEIVALAAALVAENSQGSTVVTDSITSDQLTTFIEEELGLKHLRFKRGYKNVINKAIELNESGIDCQLAIETSGHAALKENYFLDDGAYLATKIVIEAAKLSKEGKGISTLIEKLGRPQESSEYRIKIRRDDFAEYVEPIFEDLVEWGIESKGISIVAPNHEGVRINFDEENGNGWCLLRMSLHDPIMPLNVESNEVGGVAKILNKLVPVLEKYKSLDLNVLR